ESGACWSRCKGRTAFRIEGKSFHLSGLGLIEDRAPWGKLNGQFGSDPTTTFCLGGTNDEDREEAEFEGRDGRSWSAMVFSSDPDPLPGPDSCEGGDDRVPGVRR